eukprot:7957038-Heterocapsa_arctica.AAC.1
MGQRIRRPSAFQGLTKKEDKKGIIPEGDFTTKEKTYLSHQEDKRGKVFKGRGQKVTYVKNTISPPQDNTEGFAITEQMSKTQLALNRMRKYQML